MADKIQVRRGTNAQWASNNPILSSGEWGFETDTRKLKVGNGATEWNSLAYVFGQELENTIDPDVADAHTDAEKALTAASLVNHAIKRYYIVGNNIAQEFVLPHNLNTDLVSVVVRNQTTGKFYDASPEIVDVNNVKIYFSVVPTVDQYKVLLIA